MTQSPFSSVSYSTLSRGTDNLDHAAVANEFVSKGNGTFRCCTDFSKSTKGFFFQPNK